MSADKETPKPTAPTTEDTSVSDKHAKAQGQGAKANPQPRQVSPADKAWIDAFDRVDDTLEAQRKQAREAALKRMEMAHFAGTGNTVGGAVKGLWSASKQMWLALVALQSVMGMAGDQVRTDARRSLELSSLRGRIAMMGAETWDTSSVLDMATAKSAQALKAAFGVDCAFALVAPAKSAQSHKAALDKMVIGDVVQKGKFYTIQTAYTPGTEQVRLVAHDNRNLSLGGQKGVMEFRHDKHYASTYYQGTCVMVELDKYDAALARQALAEKLSGIDRAQTKEPQHVESAPHPVPIDKVGKVELTETMQRQVAEMLAAQRAAAQLAVAAQVEAQFRQDGRTQHPVPTPAATQPEIAVRVAAQMRASRSMSM